MIGRKNVTAALALGLVLATAAGPAAALSISPQRAQALRQCNAQANKFAQYTWGETQSDHLRACMARHGQPE